MRQIKTILGARAVVALLGAVAAPAEGGLLADPVGLALFPPVVLHRH